MIDVEAAFRSSMSARASSRVVPSFSPSVSAFEPSWRRMPVRTSPDRRRDRPGTILRGDLGAGREDRLGHVRGGEPLVGLLQAGAVLPPFAPEPVTGHARDAGRGPEEERVPAPGRPIATPCAQSIPANAAGILPSPSEGRAASPAMSRPVAVVAGGLLGWLFQNAVLRLMRNTAPLVRLVATLGFLIVLQGLAAKQLWDNQVPSNLDGFLPNKVHTLNGGSASAASWARSWCRKTVSSCSASRSS